VFFIHELQVCRKVIKVISSSDFCRVFYALIICSFIFHFSILSMLFEEGLRISVHLIEPEFRYILIHYCNYELDERDVCDKVY